ncbi:hypothetical protein [Thaumasiovibrio subtropicus]|uniref:hypothetical protein n=1 Tax=Thaumasiovibrio subtropicus TaxID=1891207 RepID=UPI000B36250A|nr:hypothetical protein [Thaumasiovibrio subtropicus]
MGKGGSSSSNTTTTTTNTSGSIAFQGDNLGTNVSGVNMAGDLNLTATDHGAINAALEFATDSMQAYVQGNNDVVSKAMLTTTELADNMMVMNSENLAHMAGLQGNQAAQNTENINAMMKLATIAADGGQTATSEQMKWVIFAVLAAMVVIGVKGR